MVNFGLLIQPLDAVAGPKMERAMGRTSKRHAEAKRRPQGMQSEAAPVTRGVRQRADLAVFSNPRGSGENKRKEGVSKQS
jgi:hypothetical protein